MINISGIRMRTPLSVEYNTSLKVLSSRVRESLDSEGQESAKGAGEGQGKTRVRMRVVRVARRGRACLLRARAREGWQLKDGAL